MAIPQSELISRGTGMTSRAMWFACNICSAFKTKWMERRIITRGAWLSAAETIIGIEENRPERVRT